MPHVRGVSLANADLPRADPLSRVGNSHPHTAHLAEAHELGRACIELDCPTGCGCKTDSVLIIIELVARGRITRAQ